jgi:hypothetical protein
MSGPSAREHATRSQIEARNAAPRKQAMYAVAAANDKNAAQTADCARRTMSGRRNSSTALEATLPSSRNPRRE